PAAVAGARAVPKSAFGDGDLILERALMNARHVEIQVFGDKHGNVVHFGERDCSVQRRHQKVIEESPSPAVDQHLRAQMGAAAVQAAKACDYVGAGTVEFLLDEGGEFYFLEMNTRLQVEHPVTELVTGVDLVELQLRVAAGEPLHLTQDQITLTGHAIEGRLYAEDPRAGFLPQTGQVRRWKVPDVDWLRVDHGVREGQVVSAFYDPMLAKVIAYGKTRDDAARRLARGLADIEIAGVKTNQEFLVAILNNQTFLDGEATTRFIETSMGDDPSLAPETAQPELVAVAAALWRSGGKLDAARRTAEPVWVPMTVGVAGQRVATRVFERSGHVFDVEVAGELQILRLVEIGEGRVRYELGGVVRSAAYLADGPRLFVSVGQGMRELEDLTLAPPESVDEAGAAELKAPMDGAIVDVRCKVGQKVAKGETLVVLEAMKMQHQMTAGMDAVVAAVEVTLGSQVKSKQRLVVLEPVEA
ncbi:MAG: biotin/lipoyl-containing protein, partial [Phenylobacterium sp.]